MTKDNKRNRTINMQQLNTPEAFAQRYLSTYYSFDYRPNDRKLIFNTKNAWYYLVGVTAFIKTRDTRELIGYLIIKYPNKPSKLEVVLEVFEKGFNVKYPKTKQKESKA